MNKAGLTIAATAIGLMMPLQIALADGEQALPLLPVLTAQWWQWALSIPASQNPLLDTNGEDCMVGQRGSVWFLGGSLSGTLTTVRTCSVPEEKILFFPVINDADINTPNLCGQASGNLTVKFMRSDTKSFIDGAHDLSVRIDGRYVNNLLQRVQSQAFGVALPKENLYAPVCEAAGLGTVPADIHSPAIDDGYYVLLPPLKPGVHVIQFHAEGPNTQDVTYTLTIVPITLK